MDLSGEVTLLHLFSLKEKKGGGGERERVGGGGGGGSGWSKGKRVTACGDLSLAGWTLRWFCSTTVRVLETIMCRTRNGPAPESQCSFRKPLSLPHPLSQLVQ